MKTILVALAAAASFCPSTMIQAKDTPPAAQAQPAAKPTPSKSGHVAVNGLNYYYGSTVKANHYCCSTAASAPATCSGPSTS